LVRYLYDIRMPAASVLRNVVLDEGPGRLLKCNKLARPARDRQRS